MRLKPQAGAASQFESVMKGKGSIEGTVFSPYIVC
jgi:hypothetical protein